MPHNALQIFDELNRVDAAILRIRDLIAHDDTDPEPLPLERLFFRFEGQSWYRVGVNDPNKHLHGIVTIPRVAQSGVITLPIQAVLHNIANGWSWRSLDYKTVTPSSGGKTVTSKDFSDGFQFVGEADLGLTQLFENEIKIDTTAVDDGWHDFKIRWRITRNNGNRMMNTLGFLILCENGNRKKDSPSRYTDPPRLRQRGYYDDIKKKVKTYASTNLYGVYPPNVSEELLRLDYRTKSWYLGDSGTDRTIRHALRLGFKAHTVPPNSGVSLLPSGSQWDNGNAGKNDIVNLTPFSWGVGTHNPVLITEADSKDGAVTTGIMRLQMVVE